MLLKFEPEAPDLEPFVFVAGQYADDEKRARRVSEAVYRFLTKRPYNCSVHKRSNPTIPAED